MNLIALTKEFFNNKLTLHDVVFGHSKRVRAIDEILDGNNSGAIITVPADITKEYLGIENRNLILHEDCFPENPQLGQIISINGNLHQYRFSDVAEEQLDLITPQHP